jgi:AcrR family transcriptional regulator
MSIPRPARTKGEVVKEFRTTEILEAARRVIGELGYNEASMERIAQEAGISKGTIYLYFENKEALFARAIEHGFEQLMERTRAATRRARGHTAKVSEVARSAVEYSLEYLSFYRALAERPDLGPAGSSAASEQLRYYVDGYVRYVADLLERGTRAGEFRGIDSQRAARVLLAGVRTIIDEQIREGQRPLVQEEIDTLLDLFMHGAAAGGRS